ncbi:response regulator [Streptomyces sp. NPDC059897]|uniref:response regulator transcription factor n=1 Tax=Streptomyces sp. NPDC059897 TaxID=3346994 RepID=UPI00365B7921
MDSEREPDGRVVRVAIVDDDQLVRMALRLIIDGEPDLTVVAEAADGDAAIRVVDEHRPDVVLMDVRMPGRDGLSATREVLTRQTPPRVLVLTTFDSDDMVLGALRAGALGFVLKDTPPARIADAVRTVADGNPVLSPQATARVIAAATGPQSSDTRGASREAARKRLSALTERELDTARAIADGLGNPEIAKRLHISVATVKAHTGSLFTKLAVENRVQIALLVRDAAE